MDEKVKESVLALLDAAEAELKVGNIEVAAAKIAEAKEEIKPLPGTGSTGGIK